MLNRTLLVLLALGALATAPAAAQTVNPATKQEPQEPREPWERPDLVSEAPAIVVLGQPLPQFREAERIGEYGQPRWTAHRRFPTTRIYVVPQGEVELEYWTRVKVPRSGAVQTQTQYEWEIGLGHRIQLDLYAVSNQQGNTGPLEFDEQKVEVRYAFADWDEIWGNPTAYLEWDARSNEPDVIEYKLLFGGEITPGWYWGTNLVLEHETGAARENVYELTGGVSHTLVDSQFSLGAEMKAEAADEKSDRGNYTSGFEIGPSLEWRPLPNIHLDFAPLKGIGDDSRAWDIFFVLGIEI